MKLTAVIILALLSLEAATCTATVDEVSARNNNRYLKKKKKSKGKNCDLWTKEGKGGKGGKKSKKNYSFNRVSTFPVCLQLDSDCNTDTETVAEIVTASSDGMTLIYTDSPMNAIGFVDIEDPSSPLALGQLDLGGEPTSISVWGDYAIAAINTSTDYVNTSGKLVAVDIDNKTVVKEWELGGQPDSISVSKDGKFIVIAIENERDEDLGDGIPPQMPAGYVVVVQTLESTNMDDWVPNVIDMTGLDGVNFPEDPEPEFVSINDNNIAVVTLQENNALVLINLESLQVSSSFSAGTVDLTGIDIEEEDIIDQTSSLSDIPREPDGVVFMGPNYFATADEGDMDGGSRGFTVWDVCGNTVFGSGNFFDQYAASIGHYPEQRSGNKGSEPENVAFGTFMETDFLFVNVERSNMVLVYDASNPSKPKFFQSLPALDGPEGGLAIPDRNLYVVANEKDYRGTVRAGLTIYHYAEGKPQYPTLQSKEDKVTGAPIPFAALSGLSPDPDDKDILYSVEDSFFRSSRFFKIKTGKNGEPSELVDGQRINDDDGIFASFVPNGGFGTGDNGFSAEKLSDMINDDLTVNIDSEGIAAIGDGHFYIASEGRGTIDDADRPIESLNFIFKVDEKGTIKQVLSLSAEWNSKQVRYGFEGVAYYPDEDFIIAVTQRKWGTDDHPAIHVFDIESGEHLGFGYYPLDAVASQNGGWVGLSDITYAGESIFYILERDNQGSLDAAVKKIYSIDITEATEDGHIFAKTLVKDIIDINDAIGTTPFEKYEGLAYTENGVWIINDNDGVDDNVAEIQLMNLGDI